MSSTLLWFFGLVWHGPIHLWHVACICWECCLCLSLSGFLMQRAVESGTVHKSKVNAKSQCLVMSCVDHVSMLYTSSLLYGIPSINHGLKGSWSSKHIPCPPKPSRQTLSSCMHKLLPCKQVVLLFWTVFPSRGTVLSLLISYKFFPVHKQVSYPL